MEQQKPKILDVGQCDLDHGNISRMLQSSLQADVDRAHNMSQALSAIRDHDYNLVLVNRIFDADGQEGQELISQVKEASFGKYVKIMLVSNFDDAQDAAIALGAVRGFGKNAIGEPATIELLQASIT